jgi:photosystem II stability/assembly factor-like uncharacterized protein
MGRKMRTLKISLLVFILSITISAQWEWRNPDPQANNILDSYFIDAMHGWAVGYGGACIRTTDGGESWQNLQMPIHTNFESVQFLDSNKGFIGDWGGNLLETTDGGNNWNVQLIDTYANIFIFFIDQNYGWILSSDIVTSTFKVYRTSNGGNSWQSHLLPITRDLHDIYFIDSTKGFVISNLGDILMTVDGGVNWNYVNSPVTEFLEKIIFKNPLEGFIIGANGTLLQTTDGGTLWEYRVVGQYAHVDISFFGENIGIMVGANTYITNNGGITWVQNYSIGQNGFSTCKYLDENNCIVFGSFGEIYKSTNKGNSWVSKLLGNKSAISDVIFLDTLTGFTVGSEGTLLKTFDGGDTWYKQVPLTNENLKSITFSDDLHGWVVGTNSIFLKSTTGGIGWLPDFIPDCNDLFSVDFINNNIGWVVGNFSKILKTTDGGNTWVLQPVNVSWTIDFSSVSMIDENIGYACGNYQSYQPPKGIIVKTTNGGIEWDSLQYFNTSFKSIFFQNSLNGWAVGITQHITIHTTDGGMTWTDMQIDGGNDIYFGSDLKGIKVSYGGASDITITTDGGETWVQTPGHTQQYLSAGYVVENNYWAVGSYGTILTSSNPIVTSLEFYTSSDISLINYILSQNYPNPFNPVTKIKYEIPSVTLRQVQSDISVKLKVYDILGREIATLVNEEKPAGEYEVEFNASNLPSGIYFYRLTTGNHSETKKMVLIK